MVVADSLSNSRLEQVRSRIRSQRHQTVLTVPSVTGEPSLSISEEEREEMEWEELIELDEVPIQPI